MTRTAWPMGGRALRLALAALAAAACWQPVLAQGDERFVTVRISEDIASVTVTHDGAPVTIQREQQPYHRVSEYYSYTSRPCPPFCIMPMTAAPGVETVGELELLDFLQRASNGEAVLVVDTRKAQWPRRGMIPGAVNVPWVLLDDDTQRDAVLNERFGARQTAGGWDFSAAKTLVMYCNGPWCSQSTFAIERLVAIGYPAAKLKWYRGGMQMWSNLGLTTVNAR